MTAGAMIQIGLDFGGTELRAPRPAASGDSPQLGRAESYKASPATTFVLGSYDRLMRLGASCAPALRVVV